MLLCVGRAEFIGVRLRYYPYDFGESSVQVLSDIRRGITVVANARMRADLKALFGREYRQPSSATAVMLAKYGLV